MTARHIRLSVRPVTSGDGPCLFQVLLHENKVKVDLTKYVQTHAFAYHDTFSGGDATDAGACAERAGEFRSNQTSLHCPCQ